MIGDWFIEDNYPKGVLTLIGGRPAVGKTAFGITLAISLAKQNKKCIYFSLEMGLDQLLMRMRLQLDENGYETITDKIIIDDTPAASVNHIRNHLKDTPADYILSTIFN